MTDQPLSIDEASKLLHVSRATLYREIAAKRIRLTKVRSRSFITEAECARYLKAQTDRRAA